MKFCTFQLAMRILRQGIDIMITFKTLAHNGLATLFLWYVVSYKTHIPPKFYNRR